MLAGDADAASYTTYIGKGSPRFWLGLLPVQPNESFAQMVIVAKDVEARERIKARLESGGRQGRARARRGCASIASISGRRSASPCSSA